MLTTQELLSLPDGGSIGCQTVSRWPLSVTRFVVDQDNLGLFDSAGNRVAEAQRDSDPADYQSDPWDTDGPTVSPSLPPTARPAERDQLIGRWYLATQPTTSERGPFIQFSADGSMRNVNACGHGSTARWAIGTPGQLIVALGLDDLVACTPRPGNSTTANIEIYKPSLAGFEGDKLVLADANGKNFVLRKHS